MLVDVVVAVDDVGVVVAVVIAVVVVVVVVDTEPSRAVQVFCLPLHHRSVAEIADADL